MTLKCHTFAVALIACQGCAAAGSNPSPVDSGANGNTGDDVGTGTVDSSSSSSDGPSTTRPDSSMAGPTDGGGAADAKGDVILSEGGGGDATAAQGCAGLPLCDDFESDTPGSPPSSSLWTLVGLTGCGGMGNPSAPPVYSIVVDNSPMHAHSGSNSVKVDTTLTGSQGCGPYMVNTSAFPMLTGGEVYGRFYVHMSDTTTTFDHTVLMGLGLLGDGGIGFNVQDPDSFLELASEGPATPTNVLMWQRSDSFGTLPAKNAMGEAQSAYPAANGFTCIEFHTSTSGAIQTWVDGTLITGLSDPPAPSVPTQWTAPSPLTPTSLALGWQVYSGPNQTVWFDDVALSTSRINCE